MFVKFEHRLLSVSHVVYFDVLELVSEQWYIKAFLVGGAEFTHPTHHASEAEAFTALAHLLAGLA